MDIRTRGSRLVLATLMTVLGAAVGIAYAAVPASDGTIPACYKTGDGHLRVIDAEDGQSCRQNETAIALAAPSAPVALVCPADTTMFVGVCIEDDPRAADTQRDAIRNCADEQRRLPSAGELQGFRELDGVALATGGEWTDDTADITWASSFAYLVVTQTGNFVAEAFDDYAYRCVAGPEFG